VQALIGALRERQRALRDLAKRGQADGPRTAGITAPSDGAPDTEHLRLMMLRYRSLFKQICRP